MRDVLIGTTDYTVLVKIVGTDGAPETGLAHTDIDIAYARVETDNDVTTSDVAPADLADLTTAHSDWGWEEVSATDHPGLYRLDIADAVFASGAWEAVVTITDASGTDFYAVDIGFRLVAFNATDGVRLGLTALPNAAADAAGGLPISDAGGLDLDAKIGALTFGTANRVNVQVYGMENNVVTAAAVANGAIDAATFAADVDAEFLSYIVDDATRIDASALNTSTTAIGSDGTGLTEAGGTGDHLTAINLPNQTMDIVGNITGNLSGSVGSVTGTIGGLSAAALKDFFDTDSTAVAGDAVAGSVVFEIGSLAASGGLTVEDIADEVQTRTIAGVTLVATVTNLTNAATNGDLTAAMKASVNAEADTALADYDGPTNTEMVARTLASASYATATAQTTAQADLDILTGADGVILATSQPNYEPATATALASLVSTVGVAGAGLTALASASSLAAVAADLPARITKNTALSAFPFFMVDDTDHVTAKTGLAITATRSIDGAAFAACANSATEIGSGWYKIDLAAADLNGNTIVLSFAGTGADTRFVAIVTQNT